jgi:hypothetical protein
MGHIYANAGHTCVWLGPSADNSDAAMEFIASSDSIDIRDPKLLRGRIPFSALQALFARVWWSRIWVIQEIILLKQITVRCGDKGVDFKRFTELAGKEAQLRSHYRTAAGQSAGTAAHARWTFISPGTPFYTMFATWEQTRQKEKSLRR